MSAAQIPSPADAPQFTAEQLLDEITERGGRIFRMREIAVFCLTTDPELAKWLLGLGGKSFMPRQMAVDQGPMGAYQRAEGIWEFDIYIHHIATAGDETIHEAARRYQGRKVDHD